MASGGSTGGGAKSVGAGGKTKSARGSTPGTSRPKATSSKGKKK